MFAVSTDLTALIKETLWPIGLRVELGLPGARMTERLVAARQAGFDGVELCAPEGRLTEDAISSAIEALARVPIIGLDGGDNTLPAENQSPVSADVAGERDRDVADNVQDGAASKEGRGVGASDRPFRVLALAGRVTKTDPVEAHDELTKLLESARRLGADCVNLSLSDIYGSGAENAASRVHQGGTPRPSFDYPSLPACVGRLIVQSRFAAEAVGVQIGIECGPDTAIASPVELANLIDATCTWVACACVRGRSSANSGASADWLRTLRHRVRCVRLDARPIPLDLEQVMESIRYEGAIIVDEAGQSSRGDQG